MFSKKTSNVPWDGQPFHIIAGPCAVENEETTHQIAQFLKANDILYMRGGAYKPRTSPYSFQGLGLEGLKILKQAALKHGLFTVSEIMDPRDIEQSLPYVDIIQVGSRNMQNYALLKELGKLKQPILLKRGMSATIEEWLQAAEYIKQGGNEDIVLCERGIRTFDSALRNTLDLAGAYWAMRTSGYHVIIDPSHGTGKKELIQPIALATQAMGFSGIMVEIHPLPEKALSDGAQSLDFKGFEAMLSALRIQARTD